MADQSSENKPLYQLGIWIADAGEDEFYSPGEIFIEAQEDEAFRVPRFLGACDIPDSQNLLKLIDIVSQAMVKGVGCERVYLVCLCESERKNSRLHFRLLPRYESDKGFLDELDPDVDETNDGLALMARWRKQFLLKRICTNRTAFETLRKKHEEAIERVREALHKRALTLRG